MSTFPRLLSVAFVIFAFTSSDSEAGNGDKVRTDVYGDPLPPGAVARLGSVRFRHPMKPIESLAFSPDGKILASASRARVILWDRATGNRLREFKLDFCYNAAVGFAADGKVQVLRIEDRDRNGNTTQAVLERPESKNDAIHLTLDGDCDFGTFAFSADGKRLLVAGKKNVALWDVATGKRIGGPPKEQQRIYALALSVDHGTAACIKGNSKRIELVDLVTQKILHQLGPLPDEDFRSVAFSRDGKTLFSAGLAGVRVWDTSTGKEVRRLNEENYVFLTALAVSPDGKTLAVAANGKTLISLWGTVAGKRMPVAGAEREPWNLFLERERWVLAFPQPNRVVTIRDFEAAHFWDSQSGKCLRRLGLEQGFWSSLSVSPGGELLAGWTASMRFGVWDAAGKTRWSIEMPYTEVSPLLFSPDGKMLMGLSNERNESRFVCWDAATGERLTPLATESHAFGCYLSGDGATMALRTAQGFQRFRVRPNRSWRRLGEPVDSPKNRYVHGLSPDGRTLLVMGDKSLSLGLAEAASGSLIGWFVSGKSARDTGISDAVFSPDGSVVAAAHDGAVRLWDVATRQEMERFTDNEFGVWRVVFSPDNRYVASEGSDNNVLIWKRHPPRVRDKPGHRSAVDVDGLWSDLANAKAEVAWPAIRKLTTSPQQTVPFLKTHLSPERKGEARRLSSLLADLDSDSYAVRQKAYRELEQEGERAVEALEETLERKPSLELRKRLLELLETAEKIRCERSLENLRTIRAVQVLELIGNAEARQVLKNLSEGTDGALRTQEARAALRRMAK